LSKKVSKLLIVVGVIFTVWGLGLHTYYVMAQRLHIEGLTEFGLSWGLSLILIGIIYAFEPRTLTKAVMVVLMSFANIGFLFALWVLLTAPRTGTAYYQYLYYVKWILLPPWLFINTAGAYYLLKAGKWHTHAR
jgi:hypothetical protein